MNRVRIGDEEMSVRQIEIINFALDTLRCEKYVGVGSRKEIDYIIQKIEGK